MKLKSAFIFLFVFITVKLSASSHQVYKDDTLPEGEGKFVFDGYKPLAHKPINVYYYNPGNPNADVLMVMHGNGRNVEGYYKALLKYAKKHKVILIAPEFDAKQFPTIDYHNGSIKTKSGKIQARELWTFSMIEPLFDYVKKETGTSVDNYLLYGFSAGSQFVHRYLQFVPNARVKQAISASAGTYTMPDSETIYPFGIKDVDIKPEALKSFYGKKITIMVGTADTVLSRPDLVKTAIANAQGRDRVERGNNYFKKAAETASTLSTPFNWKFRLVPGAGHSQSEMAKTVASVFFLENDEAEKK